jgi:hypothetical protein
MRRRFESWAVFHSVISFILIFLLSFILVSPPPFFPIPMTMGRAILVGLGHARRFSQR